MHSHSHAVLESLPDLLRGRCAIYREGTLIARVGIETAMVTDDVLAMTVTSMATRGLNSAGIPYELGAHGSLLFASHRYVAATYSGWQLYLDDGVIANTLKLVGALGAGKTYRTDYVSTPSAGLSRFSASHKPGPVAAALFEFLRRQQIIELRDFPNALYPPADHATASGPAAEAARTAPAGPEI